MQDYKKEFIEFMVGAGVLRFGDFTTKSGRKTPYFVNTGNYRTGAQMAKLGEYYARCFTENVRDCDVLFGPAYKGIPLVVTTASSLYRESGIDLPFCFNRKEAKDHGEGGVLVGAPLFDGAKVTVIEDVITAGTAVRETVPILLSAAKVQITDMIISVDRMEKGPAGISAIAEVEREFGIKVHPIVTVREIMEALGGGEILTDELLGRMEAYLAEYGV